MAMGYSTGCRTTFHHHYNLVWDPKYRYKLLRGEVRLRAREIIRQVSAEMGVTIINGALSSDHVRMFVAIPPQISMRDSALWAKVRSSRKIQQEFELICKRYALLVTAGFLVNDHWRAMPRGYLGFLGCQAEG